MGCCYYCGAEPYTWTCDQGFTHTDTMHVERGCPKWYDVGGDYEPLSDGTCPTHTVRPPYVPFDLDPADCF